jgi:hypothetical protein
MGRRIALVGSLLVFLVATSACGSGGGGGSGLEAGPADWGIPFLPDTSSLQMRVHVRNLSGSGATATFQGYMPNGTPYPGPFTVTLDGDDEHSFSASTALLGATPAGGWIHVTTPSRRVEVAFNVNEPSFPAEESARAWPLGDLTAPPPSTFTTITVNPRTDFIQISNATVNPLVVTVNAYREPASDPLLPPVQTTPPPISLLPFETKTFSPSGLTGISGFIGNVTFDGPTPFLTAAREELAFDGQPLAVLRSRLWYTSLDFGTVTASPASFEDFALQVTNQADVARTVTIDQIRTEDSGIILVAPRTILLAAHESRIMTSQDPPFLDLFGDPTASAFQQVWMELSVPDDVAFSFRQFDPLGAFDPMTVKAHPVGHVFHTLDVFPEPTTAGPFRTITTVINPFASAITVDVTALIPQPDGFDAGIEPLVTLTVPARSSVDFSPDGAIYLDRDGVAAPLIGLRFVGNVPFSVAGRRVQVNAFDQILTRSPLIVRDFDDAE